MKTGNFSSKIILVAAIAFLICAFQVPEGWTVGTGKGSKDYEAGLDKGAGRDSSDAITIKSKRKRAEDFGTIFQKALPGKFLGKRIRMSAYARSENIVGWGGLWMRVDQENPLKAVSFDNMNDRKIIGNTPWTKYNIVLDVPENASAITYGGLLEDGGQLWMDNFSFEIVSDTVKVTGSLNAGINKRVQTEPTNTDFDKK